YPLRNLGADHRRRRPRHRCLSTVRNRVAPRRDAIRHLPTQQRDSARWECVTKTEERAGDTVSLVYQCRLPLSTHTVNHLARLLRRHLKSIGSRWRSLPPGKIAVIVLAVLRHDQRLADMAGGNNVAESTVRRWRDEMIHLLAARAPRLDRALKKIAKRGGKVVLVDGTLIPTQRRTGRDNRKNFSGKHHRHGLHFLALTDEKGRLIWISAARPGRTHDATAARHDQLVNHLKAAGLRSIPPLAKDPGHGIDLPEHGTGQAKRGKGVRARGINYDTGFLPGEELSRKSFTPETVQHDMAVISRELHCDVVRISGREPERLSIAARHAADTGLEVWFAPFPVDLPHGQLLPFFADCAQRAEAVREAGADVVFVAGCEISAFCGGFIPGDTYGDRLRAMASADMEWWSSLGPVQERLNEFLSEAAATARTNFGGRITYASAPWEFVDWHPFDFVGIDAYRAAYNADSFRDELRGHLAHGKPVAVTEYGTCAYQGAGERGGMAWQVPHGAVPDEDEQARYFTELLDIFEEEGVDTALWFTFAGYSRPRQHDLGSYGVVRVLDEARWEPKKIFHTMAVRHQHG
ncbi:transposase family protein, partial [Streptomyces scabiei]|uniref:transposase family protein n=1 Tax=Streptomyces scabiei TaxID=1930 RepID=UPI001F1CEF1B